MKINRIFYAALLLCLTGCAGATGIEVNKTPAKRDAMVVTANPHATRAGAAILRAGGSAVDAAIAVESVLSLVEPQSSGLGGGGFLTFYDAKSKELVIYDGRETAPASATPELFLDDGKPFGYIDSKNSGLSIGVPGMVSMLQLAHHDYGKLPWGEHFSHARTLAVEGFPISPRLQNFLVRFGKYIPKGGDEGPDDAYRYFYDDDGNAWPVGHRLKNPDYAKTLDLIAADPRSFYSGPIADQIVAQAGRQPRAGGLSKSDLSEYSAQRRKALCSPYRDLQVCGPPPPSSWIAVAMILGLLQHSDGFSAGGAGDPANWTLFAEAQRLAYADRDHYVADSDAVEVPVQGLLDQRYLASRAKAIDVQRAIPEIKQGDPWAYQDGVPKVAGLDNTPDIAGTTHFVVVDGDGNVVSMTASVESIFGSTRMAGGMFLNNQLTDFSRVPTDDKGLLAANAAGPGKRPRSSMSPTIVLDAEGEFLLATGSPGGNSIIAYTAKTLVGVLDWQLTPQQAIDLPNMVARGDKVRIEKERASPVLVDGLRKYGYQVKESAGENSGLHMVLKDSNGQLTGGVDPRREGTIEIVKH